MAWGIFSNTFNYDFRPKKAVCQEIKASPDAQSVKRELLDAAIKAGSAKEVKAPKSDKQTVADTENSAT